MGADLASTPLAAALTSKGFDPSQSTLFTCEGIFSYLPQVLPTLPMLISFSVRAPSQIKTVTAALNVVLTFNLSLHHCM